MGEERNCDHISQVLVVSGLGWGERGAVIVPVKFWSSVVWDEGKEELWSYQSRSGLQCFRMRVKKELWPYQTRLCPQRLRKRRKWSCDNTCQLARGGLEWGEGRECCNHTGQMVISALWWRKLRVRSYQTTCAALKGLGWAWGCNPTGQQALDALGLDSGRDN